MIALKQFAKGFLEGTKEFGSNINTIINFILLFIVYFIGVGLTCMFAKLRKKHFLDMKLIGDSYWSELNLKEKPIQDYYRQF